MSSPSNRPSTGPALSFTPRVVPRAGPDGTPAGRAKSVEPPSSRRSVHTPATGGGGGGSGRQRTTTTTTPGTNQRQGLSASARKVTEATTPHARAAFRALDSRRAAIFTPGKNRRRSGRDQRETPRDLLRNLSRRLAPTSQPLASSSSSSPDDDQKRQFTSDIATILEDDDDDDIPIDPPRLSLPMDDEDDSDLRPHQSAGIEDLDFTLKSVELPRRALSEQALRRYSRSSPGSAIRISDYIQRDDDDDDDGSDDAGPESTFFEQGAFDAAFGEEPPPPEDITYERLDSEAGRLAAGRESGVGVLGGPVDMNESTFLMTAQALSSPARPSVHFEDDYDDDVALDGGPQTYGDDNDDNDDGDDMAARVSDAEELADVEMTTEARAHAASTKQPRPKRGVKVSKHGIQYPSLPPAVVKRLAQTFAHTSGVGRSKISPDTLLTIMQASDWFFEQLGDDLQAYAKHAGRKTIDESDMLTLMKRQRQTNSTTTPFSLAQRHLPRELLQELRMTPPAPTKKRRKPAVGRVSEDG